MDWGVGGKEDDVQEAPPCGICTGGDGWSCPTLRWEPLGMTGSGQSREVWKITSHSTFPLFPAMAPCTVLT